MSSEILKYITNLHLTQPITEFCQPQLREKIEIEINYN